MPRGSRLYCPQFALVSREANPDELRKKTARGATGTYADDAATDHVY
jgi:hypothetical protein